MASGFKPDHSTELPLNGLTPEQFLVIATETVKILSWNITYLTRHGFVAYSRPYGEEVRLILDENGAVIQSKYPGAQLAGKGRGGKSIQAFIALFAGLYHEMTPEEVALKYEKIKESFSAEDEGDLLSSNPSGEHLSLLWPGKGYFVTPVLIYINLFIFILMIATGVGMITPGGEDLIRWGANYRPLTLNGQWWRLLSCCFIHIGLLHLVMNMYALMFIGLLLEPYMGKVKFMTAYLLTGIAASTVSLAWHDLTISAGASGAIFGLYGVFLALLTTNHIEKSTRKALLGSILVFVAYNLGNGMKDGIDNAAHLGGLVSGLAIGYAFYPSLKQPENKRLQHLSITVVTVLVILGSFLVYRKLPNDIPKYEERMKAFSSMEVMALDVYNLPKNTPRSELLAAIKDKGMYYLKENIRLIDEVDQLAIPASLKQKDALLKTYCELRLESYGFYYKSVEENTSRYNDSIQQCMIKIEEVMRQLKARQ